MEAGEPTKRKSRASLLEFPIQLLRQDLCLVGKIEGPEEILSRQCLFGIGQESLNRREGVLLFLGELLLIDLRHDLFSLLNTRGGIAFQLVFIRHSHLG